MKAEELKGKTADELQKVLMDLKKQQFGLRMQKSQGQLENTAQIRVVRRAIARVKTLIGQQVGGAVRASAKAEAGAKKQAAKKAPAKKAASKAKKTDDKAA